MVAACNDLKKETVPCKMFLHQHREEFVSFNRGSAWRATT